MILHIAHKDEWEAAQRRGWYEDESLNKDGFIHCSTPEQVLIPANAIYQGQTDLVLYCIDPARLEAPLVYEDCYESGQEFPHIYGRLNLDAVVKIVDFPPNQDGTFTLPPLGE